MLQILLMLQIGIMLQCLKNKSCSIIPTPPVGDCQITNHWLDLASEILRKTRKSKRKGVLNHRETIFGESLADILGQDSHFLESVGKES